jgi:hypothetical protein
MANHHTTSVEIKYGSNSEGFFSFEEPETLVIFVHGFGGKALGTWSNFPLLTINDIAFKKCDIIYYGYDTFQGQAGDHSAELYAFIDKAVTPLANNILPAGQNLPERNYKRIILVAHSLGAVLARQAQILGHIAKKTWVQKSELALYAPAHNGAEVISLAKEALSGPYGLLGIFARFRFPILTDLDAHDDGILKSIKEYTAKVQDKGEGDFTKAKLVVYAKNDKVVKSYQYYSDMPAYVVPGASHISVCKPNESFMKPHELLRNILSHG